MHLNTSAMKVRLLSKNMKQINSSTKSARRNNPKCNSFWTKQYPYPSCSSHANQHRDRCSFIAHIIFIFSLQRQPCAIWLSRGANQECKCREPIKNISKVRHDNECIIIYVQEQYPKGEMQRVEYLEENVELRNRFNIELDKEKKCSQRDYSAQKIRSHTDSKRDRQYQGQFLRYPFQEQDGWNHDRIIQDLTLALHQKTKQTISLQSQLARVEEQLIKSNCMVQSREKELRYQSEERDQYWIQSRGKLQSEIQALKESYQELLTRVEERSAGEGQSP